MSTTTKYTEEQVRAQRDRVYGYPISDEEWDKCKSNWMQESEAEWLFSHPTES